MEHSGTPAIVFIVLYLLSIYFFSAETIVMFIGVVIGVAIFTFAVGAVMTERVSDYPLIWSTERTGNEYSYIELKRVKLFDYYYIVDNDEYKSCKSHPDYERGLKELRSKIK